MAKNAGALHSVEDHFRGRDPSVRATYDRILETAQRFGTVGEEAKKTSIHLTNKTAFAGVATRRSSLVLTLRLPHDLESRGASRHRRIGGIWRAGFWIRWRSMRKSGVGSETPTR